MAAVWPEYAKVRATGLTLTAAPSVERQRYEDGVVRQAPAVTGITLIRGINVLLSPSELDRFRSWAGESASSYFSWRDRFDGKTRQARVVAAAAGITYSQQRRRESGKAIWTADLQIESAPERFPAPTEKQLATWPDALARVASSLTLHDDRRVDRSSIEGQSAVRQARRERTAPVLRSVGVQVLRGQFVLFLNWLLAYFHRDFDWTDQDGVTRRVRIRDGAGGVRLTQEGRLAGPARWTAELELEDLA